MNPTINPSKSSSNLHSLSQSTISYRISGKKVLFDPVLIKDNNLKDRSWTSKFFSFKNPRNNCLNKNNIAYYM